jgi:hypothetical protein
MCINVSVWSEAEAGRVAMVERPEVVMPVQCVRESLVSAGKDRRLESLNAVDGICERTNVLSPGRDWIVRSRSFGGESVAPKWQ